VEQRFGVRVSLTLVGRWLRRWGFTPQKPMRRAWEQNPQKVEYWLKVRYPRVRRQAKAEGAEIHWGDEMGLRSDHQAGTTYGRKGRTPVVPGTGQRWRCNMISTITNPAIGGIHGVQEAVHGRGVHRVFAAAGAQRGA